MAYRQNFRGHPDNRFRYNGPPGRGGRGGGYNRNAGMGAFMEQRRDTFPQHGRQQNQSKPNVNKNSNSNSKQAITGVNPPPAKKEPTTPVQTTKPAVQPLMEKEVPKKVEKQEKPVASVDTKAKVTVEKPAAPTPPPVKKPHSATPTTDAGKSSERSGSNKRPSSGYQGPPQNRNNQDGNRDQNTRHGNSNRSRFDNSRNNQDSGRSQSRFGSPPGHGQGHSNHGEAPHSQSHQGQAPRHDFGDDLVTEIRVEKKFTGRCRLFIGNLPNDTTDDAFKKLFDKFGEINEVFLNKQKMFGFIRLDTRLNAETAKKEMDGATFKGRVIRVRFAAHGAALKVKNLPPVVSNELLEEAFGNFGEVERSIVIVDDRGKSTGEGIVEFARKPAAQAAIKKIKEGVFLLTASTVPIQVEPLEQKNDEDGLPEKNVPKNQTFYQEREAPPRFAQRNTFEHEWGQRMKQQAAKEETERAELEAKFVADRKKLMEEGELARHDFHTMQMRQELLHRQKELERLEEQRKDLEARRQGLNMQREDRFMGGGGGAGQGGMMGEESLRRQQQQQEANMQQQLHQQQQSLEMQQQQSRAEEMSRRDTDRFGAPPPLPPSMLMDSSDKGRMEQSQDNLQNQQRQSRFDVGPGAGGAFNGNMAGGAMGAAAMAQQEMAGVNFGGMQGAGGLGNNPRPLMEELSAEMMGGDFTPKRQRRY